MFMYNEFRPRASQRIYIKNGQQKVPVLREYIETISKVVHYSKINNAAVYNFFFNPVITPFENSNAFPICMYDGFIPRALQRVYIYKMPNTGASF